MVSNLDSVLVPLSPTHKANSNLRLENQLWKCLRCNWRAPRDLGVLRQDQRSRVPTCQSLSTRTSSPALFPHMGCQAVCVCSWVHLPLQQKPNLPFWVGLVLFPLKLEDPQGLGFASIRRPGIKMRAIQGRKAPSSLLFLTSLLLLSAPPFSTEAPLCALGLFLSPGPLTEFGRVSVCTEARGCCGNAFGFIVSQKIK